MASRLHSGTTSIISNLSFTKLRLTAQGLLFWQPGLREVWGYLWTSWYAPKVWKLWARSTSPYVSRLRTTMGTENFWRQLKHNYLHHTLRPRLDHLVWILLNKVTPEHLARAEVLEDTHRLGRSEPLSAYQRYFESAWQALAQLPVSGRMYVTSVGAHRDHTDRFNGQKQCQTWSFMSLQSPVTDENLTFDEPGLCMYSGVIFFRLAYGSR